MEAVHTVASTAASSSTRSRGCCLLGWIRMSSCGIRPLAARSSRWCARASDRGGVVWRRLRDEFLQPGAGRVHGRQSRPAHRCVAVRVGLLGVRDQRLGVRHTRCRRQSAVRAPHPGDQRAASATREVAMPSVALIASPAHRALAHRVAVESIVLLKNETTRTAPLPATGFRHPASRGDRTTRGPGEPGR
jgi:hypothetical protein